MPFDLATALPIKQENDGRESVGIGFDVASSQPVSAAEEITTRFLDSDNVLIQTAKDLFAGIEQLPVAAGYTIKLAGEAMKIESQKETADFPVTPLSPLGLGPKIKGPKKPLKSTKVGKAVDRFLYKWGDVISKYGDEVNNFYMTAANNGIEAPNPAILMGWKYPFRKIASLSVRNAPLMGVAAGVTAITKNPVAGATLFAPLAAGDLYEDALKNGIAPEKAMDMAMATGAAQTALEVIPLSGWMKGGSLVKRVARTALQEGLIEEGNQQLFDNSLRIAGWKEPRPVWDRLTDGLAESILAGAVTGGALGMFEAPGIEDVREDLHNYAIKEGVAQGLNEDQIVQTIKGIDQVIDGQEAKPETPKTDLQPDTVAAIEKMPEGGEVGAIPEMKNTEDAEKYGKTIAGNKAQITNMLNEREKAIKQMREVEDINEQEAYNIGYYKGQLYREAIEAATNTGSIAASRGGKPVDTQTQAQPIAGEGEIRRKVRALSAGVAEKAIENKLTNDYGALPEYEVVNMASQASKAQALLDQDYTKAVNIAMGLELPPIDILPESIFVAVENRAIANKNVDLLRNLAVSSQLTAQATAMGQRIRALAERDPESPVGAMNEIAKIREESAKKRLKTNDLRKAHKDMIQKAKQSMRSHAAKVETWAEFIESIKC